MKDDEEKLSGEGFVAETHNPPSRIRGGGIHIQVGEDIIPHRDLEEVLADLPPIGGCVRDFSLSGPIDYGNEMHVGSQKPIVQIGGKAYKIGFGSGSDPKPK